MGSSFPFSLRKYLWAFHVLHKPSVNYLGTISLDCSLKSIALSPVQPVPASMDPYMCTSM